MGESDQDFDDDATVTNTICGLIWIYAVLFWIAVAMGRLYERHYDGDGRVHLRDGALGWLSVAWILLLIALLFRPGATNYAASCAAILLGAGCVWMTSFLFYNWLIYGWYWP